MSQLLPLANLFTLGVSDFEGECDFYRRLGLFQVFDSPDFAVFGMRGAALALFPIEKLAADARVQPEPSRGGIRFSIIINVDSPEEVDELADRALKAGGRLTKEPVDAEFFDGRSAYFSDPEGNYWEAAWAAARNPVASAIRRVALGLPPEPETRNR